MALHQSAAQRFDPPQDNERQADTAPPADRADASADRRADGPDEGAEPAGEPAIGGTAAPSTAPSANAASGETAPAEAAPAAAPAFVPMHPLRAAGYFAASMVLALSQGFGQAVISANAQQLQGSFGATRAEVTWLVAAYLAPNVSLTLALVKIRAQYGLRNFAELSILGFLLASFLNYAAGDLHTAIAVRFMSGMAAAPMTTLAFLYMLEPLPPQRKMTVGLSLAMTLLFLGTPFTQLVSPHLLDVGLWHGLTALEVALAMIGFGLIYMLPLSSPPRERVIHSLDIISYLLIAIGMGAAAVVLTLGNLYWWLEAPWLGWLLALSVAVLALAASIELNRKDPLIDIRWLTSPPILHFSGALLLFRIVLAEQTSGAPGLFRALGLGNEQMQTMFVVVLAATLAGGITCAFLLKPNRVPAFHVVALLLIIAGALMDSGATSQTRPEQLYASQAMLGFASAIFLPPAALTGITSALAKGRQYLLSFIIVFLTTQKLGGVLGSAIFQTFVTLRNAFHVTRLSETLTMTDPAITERLSTLGGAYGSVLTDKAAMSVQGLSSLSGTVKTEASVLAYNDAFLAVAVLAAAALLALLIHVTSDWLRARAKARRELSAAAQAA
nr:MFS transporter [Acuticoccus sediminis]